ncbi:unnamed protein product, partial [Vitis vinifera]
MATKSPYVDAFECCFLIKIKLLLNHS